MKKDLCIPVEHLEIKGFHKVLGNRGQPQENKETIIICLFIEDLVDKGLEFFEVIKVEAEFIC